MHIYTKFRRGTISRKASFIAFLAYCRHVTLSRRLRALAPGLTSRSVLEKFAVMQIIDVHPADHRRSRAAAPRYTSPNRSLASC